MASYYGRVVSPPTAGAPKGASGSFMITIPPRGRPGMITGRLKIGSMPRQAQAGFDAPYMGGDTFEASGGGRRGQGLDQMHIAVIVRGRVSPDGNTAAGTVTAIVNGVDQPEWTFVGAVQGTKLPEVSSTGILGGASTAMGGASGVVGTGAVGSFDPGAAAIGMDDPGLLTRLWNKTPGLAKVAAGLGAAIGGVYFWRRRK